MAIATGVALAGPPVAAFNLWLNSLVERRSEEELNVLSRRTVALAEFRIGRALTVVNELASHGVDSCRPAHLEQLRQATFGAGPVKELSVMGPDGRTLCSDTGNLVEPRKLISSEPAATGGDTLLEVIRVGERPGNWLRIRRPMPNGSSLAALVPSEFLIVQISNQGALLNTHARMTTRGGTLIAEAGGGPQGGERSDQLNVSLPSERYALTVSLSQLRASVVAGQGELRTVGQVSSGLLAILILAITLLLPKRQRDNPVAELERAMKAGEFVPYYQPIVDIRSGRLHGAEVLIRWRKPDGTVIPPASFIPLAESSGLIIEMTRDLMRRVCLEIGVAASQRPHIKIGFNLTARHFADETIVDDVRKIFNKSALRLSQVVLEVTERQPLDNLTETRRVVAALQGLGVRIAIDDVGTGHSGLSYMLKLGVDIIKIDKMFIDSLGTDRHSNTIIETLIDLAQNMRMDIIAEGVETFEQVVHLRDLGIRQAQGYVFAPPLPGSSFLKLMEAIDPLKKPEEQAEAAAAAIDPPMRATFNAA